MAKSAGDKLVNKTGLLQSSRSTASHKPRASTVHYEGGSILLGTKDKAARAKDGDGKRAMRWRLLGIKQDFRDGAKFNPDSWSTK